MKWQQWGLALLVMSVAMLLAYGFEQWLLPSSGTVLILQLGVLIVALLTSFLPALCATMLGVLCFNFLFTEPRLSLHMSDVDEIMTMLAFIAVALATSHLATSFRTQQAELRKAQLRSNILTSLSHDLRTPLASVIGTLSTLQTYQDKLAKPERDELLQAALDESDRLHHYIENLLQATRLQYNELQLKASPQAIGPLITAVLARFPEQHRLHLLLAPALPPVEVQGSLVQQALYNVIDNALKYSPKELPVTVQVTQQDADTVVVMISDQGPGIAKEHQPHIFKMFYSTRQGDAGTGGTGLGLTVAAGIIAAHHGSIRLQPSTLGCVIEIRLPVSQQD